VVLDAARAGDPHRRCARLAGPIEVRRALASVNSLLDHLSTPTPDEREEERRVDVERVALVHLLEEHDGAVVLVDGEGEVLAANRLGLLVLGGENGESLKAWTRGLADRRDDAGDGSENGHEATALRGGVGWICRIDGLQDMDEAPRHG
jgi:hypothetical protein